MSQDIVYLQTPVSERSTRFLTGTFTDRDGAISKDRLVGVRFTLTDVDSETIIASRDHVEILDDNNGEVSAGGDLTLELTPTENVIVGTAVPIGGLEEHRALIEFTFDASREGKVEIFFPVRNLSRVP